MVQHISSHPNPNAQLKLARQATVFKSISGLPAALVGYIITVLEESHRVGVSAGSERGGLKV